MKIGKICELIPNVKRSVCISKNAADISSALSGDSLSLKWSVIRNGTVEYKFNIGRPCFVDRAVVIFGNKTSPVCVGISVDGVNTYSYRAETGKTITERTLELTAGVLCSYNVILSFECDFSDLNIESVELYGATLDGCDIFPTPNEAEIRDELIDASFFDSFCADSDEGIMAGRILAEKLYEITGVRMREFDSGFVSFVTDKSITPDGYLLDVRKDGATITASNLRGLVMGAETLIKLAGKNGICTAKINDSPRLPFRGVHLFVPSEESLEYANRLIKYVISPMGYNAVIMEIAGHGIKFDSHPEITEAVEGAIEKAKQGLMPPFPHGGVAEGRHLDKSLLREHIAYIRSFGIDVIPEVQSLGHVQFMTYAYPELAEVSEETKSRAVDTRTEDALPADLYPHCYCPQNELSYKILFDMLDEIIELFEPREYVHMGHDEVYQIGICPKCKDKDPAELFASDVNRIYGYLKSKGLKMMIWSDMLQPVTRYKTPPAIDLIPKDILMLDFIWYFHLDKDIEDNLLEKGFKVAIGNLYSSHFPRFEGRITKDGIVGGQISAWVPTNERELQKEGKLYDLFMTAQMLWSDSYSHLYTLVYDRMISCMMPFVRQSLKGIEYPSFLDGADRESLGTAPTNVNKSFGSLIFVHSSAYKTARMPWQEQDVLGHYVITYTDGERDIIPIRNGGNIGYFGRRQNEPYKHPLYRHNGYTASYECDSETRFDKEGRIYTEYYLEHILKNKPIESVKLEESPNFPGSVMFTDIIGIKHYRFKGE